MENIALDELMLVIFQQVERDNQIFAARQAEILAEEEARVVAVELQAVRAAIERVHVARMKNSRSG